MSKEQTEAYNKSIAMMRECLTPHGFVAAAKKKDNYYRIWGRDSAIMGLAALQTDEDDLVNGFRNSLLTLAEAQGQHGEIPSNVDPVRRRVSYGGTAGRVDATLWFVIGCGQYYKRTQDEQFLDNVLPVLKRCIWLLGAWEFNLKGLIYVPQTGDWADEYVQEGYVLYDQVLYYRALKEFSHILEVCGEDESNIKKKHNYLKKLIRSNYWVCDLNKKDPNLYHQVLFRRSKKFCSVCKQYWMPHFTPSGYGYRFDAFANILVSLFGIADDNQRNLVDKHIDQRFAEQTKYLLPAFHPVIKPLDKDWAELFISFSYTFKNRPYEFHNGGLWPMLTGFYVLDLALRRKKTLAEKYLDGINQANSLTTSGRRRWGFHEFLHGRSGQPLGTAKQGWSASAGVLAYHALKHPKKILL